MLYFFLAVDSPAGLSFIDGLSNRLTNFRNSSKYNVTYNMMVIIQMTIRLKVNVGTNVPKKFFSGAKKCAL
jgi:hypothetical protein